MALCLIVVWSAAVGIPTGQAQGERPSIIFMHHSTGGNLLYQGNLRELLSDRGYDLWDHGYNDDGLTDPEGNSLGINWDVPGDNTDPDGWAVIFSQPYTDPPVNTFSHMLQHDVIIFKSCFPSSNIEDDEMFAAYQGYFQQIRDIVDQYPDKIFIAFTTPPLVPNETSADNAVRARQWAAYLTSDEYLAGHPNLFVFDFFNLLADEDGYLREEYRSDEWDSHPNERANRAIAPVLADFVDQVVTDFVPGEPHVVPVLATTVPAFETDESLSPGPTIDDIEQGDIADSWWSYTDGSEDSFSCTVSSPGFESEFALQLSITLDPGLYAGCGREVQAGENWGEAEGLQFSWQSDTPDLTLGVIMMIDGTPFEQYLATDGASWATVTLSWSDFTRAEWAEAGGPDVFDPTLVTELGLAVGDWQNRQQGTMWIDDLRLAIPAE